MYFSCLQVFGENTFITNFTLRFNIESTTLNVNAKEKIMKSFSFFKLLLFIVLLSTVIIIPFSCSKTTPVQPNPSISASCFYGDTLEITICIDRSWYEIPDIVDLSMEVKNIKDDTMFLDFFDHPGYNFAVYDTSQTELWLFRGSQYPNYWIDTLLPDSSSIFPITWDMKDDSGKVVSPSIYEVVGWIGFYPISNLRSPFLSLLLK